jgi:hypothetical protein
MTPLHAPRTVLAHLLLCALIAGALACGRTEPAREATSVQRPDSSTGRGAPDRPAGPTGRIRGVVTLQGAAPSQRSEPVLQNKDVCGAAVPVTRLSVGKDNGIRHAFVYLDDVKTEGPVKPRASTQVEQKRCEYGPHAMTMTAGADLEILNDDPILHNVHARTATPDGLTTVFNIAQPVRGQRTKVNAPLDKPGIVALTCEAGHPWMTAYILVAGHPYVATTGDNGEFVIEDVPAGMYPIKMWHEGVRLTQIIPSLQRYEWEAPYELTQQVVVPAAGEVVVNFTMALRAPL